MEESTPSPPEQSDGIVSKFFDFCLKLLEMNDPLFIPLLSVMVLSGAVLVVLTVSGTGGSALNALGVSDSDTTQAVAGQEENASKGVGLGLGSVAASVVLVITFGLASLGVIARSFFGRGDSTRMTPEDSMLLFNCQEAELGKYNGIEKCYITKLYNLRPEEATKKHEEIVQAFNRLRGLNS